jgi:hypothetical protein
LEREGPDPVVFLLYILEEKTMKFGYILATAAAIALAVPSLASAETTIVTKRHVHRDHGWHHGWRHNWHRHHRPDRVVVIKRHRHHHDD